MTFGNLSPIQLPIPGGHQAWERGAWMAAGLMECRARHLKKDRKAKPFCLMSLASVSDLMSVHMGENH